MSLYNYEKPWLLSLKGAAFILIGIISIVQIKYSLPILLLVLLSLLILNVIVRFGEAFMGKQTQKKPSNIVAGIVSLLLVAWFAFALENFDFSEQSLEASRYTSHLPIFIWMVFMSLASLYEGISLRIKKRGIGYIFLIDGILLGLMAYLFYLVFNTAADLPKALGNFGIYSLCVGVISLILAKILSAKVTKENATA